jgi:hypothetical protein
MSLVITGSRNLVAVISMAVDRMLIPLAVIVGLSGGAMIGSELVKLQAPVNETIH